MFPRRRSYALPLAAVAVFLGSPALADQPLSFNRDIRPIMSDTCFHCHGFDAKTREANLRLDVREAALKEAESGAIPIVPGKPEASEIIRRIFSDDNDVVMPPPEAPKAKVLCRLSLDLTGLPPTPEETAAFLADPAADAYEKQVARLLASPHFGERMAVWWLDVARFTDTVGFHGDQNQRIFPYRDYVINAFNSNKRFDQFTIEQLAGDLLLDPTPEQLVATGYNRLNMMTREGGAQLLEYIAKYGALDPLRVANAAVRQAIMRPAEQRDAGEQALIADAWLTSTGADRPALDRARQLAARVRTYRDGRAWSMVTKAVEPLTIRVLPRGNWQDESGPIVTPATPSFLPGQIQSCDQKRLTRLDLARWICSKDNPIMPRAVMNRLWAQFFGTGLSMPLDDLGSQGELQSHPELLDWLAGEFRDGGWDIKRMIATIVTSAPYRQSSNLRPEPRDIDRANRLLASQNPRRLDAEFVRDNALFIAGLLNTRDIGGPSVRTYQPAGYYSGLQFLSREYVASPGPDQWRRGVYVHWQQTFLHPMLQNLDAPARDECAAQRTLSNMPQQALTLLNDLKQRGMLEDTLILWGGEFGRTPMGQGSGRDHHILGFSVFLAGGGVKSGMTYGATDELGYRAVENVVSVHDLHATMLALLGIDHTRLATKFQGLDVRLTGIAGEVVKDIMA